MELGPEGQKILLESNSLNVPADVKQQVIDEFLQTTDGSALGGAIRGGTTVASGDPFGFPKPTPGPSSPSGSSGGRRPLDFLRRVDIQQLFKILRKEHPQTIALVLSHLDRGQASSLLAELSPNLQAEVARRVAETGRVVPEVLNEVEKVLEQRLFSIVEGDYSSADGKEVLFEILSKADRSTEDKIISGLTVKNPHLAGDLKTKLCDFEDLNNVDDFSLLQVLRLTDTRDLCHALKGANKDLAERIYRSMPPETARALRGDVEVLPQPSWEEIKAAQQQIRNILRGLVALGKIKFK